MDYNFSVLILSVIIISNLYNLNFIKLEYKHIIILNIAIFTIMSILDQVSEALLAPSAFFVIVIYLYSLAKDFALSILWGSLAILILLLIDGILGCLITGVFYISQNTMFQLKEHYKFFYGLLLLLNFVCTKFIGVHINKIFTKNHKNRNKVITLISINILIILIVAYVLSMIGKLLKIYTAFLGINTFLIVILCITIIIILNIYQEYMRKDLHDIYVNKELNQLKKYVCAVEDMYNEIRRIKHDYVNILCSINGYIEDNNIKGLKKYFNENILKLNDSLSISSGNLMKIKYIKVDGVKGLIFSKMLQAKNKSVDLFLDISEDIEKFHLESIDLCKILGILLDNAIEEAELCTNPKIKFGIINCTSSVVIVIINSCRSNIPHIYKMFEYGFSTKGENRGIGLSNVKNIIDKKYSNVTLNTYVDNGEFKQELIIDHKQN